MSRKRGNNYGKRAITLYLSEEDSIAIDHWAMGFNLDSRQEAAVAIFRAGLAQVPVDTAIFEICQAAIQGLRRTEADALVEYHQQRAALYRLP